MGVKWHIASATYERANNGSKMVKELLLKWYNNGSKMAHCISHL
jgi:hypothetical protein